MNSAVEMKILSTHIQNGKGCMYIVYILNSTRNLEYLFMQQTFCNQMHDLIRQKPKKRFIIACDYGLNLLYLYATLL